MSTIDAASAASAKAAAKRTDTAQPVKNTDGSIAYYVTPSGSIIPASYGGLWNNTSAVTPKATDPATGNTYSRDANGNVTGVERPGDKQKQQAADQAAAAAAQQAGDASTALKNSAAQAAHGWVWVNGQLQQMVLDPKTGQYIVTYQGGGLQTTGKDGKVTSDPTQPQVPGTAFGALPTSTQDAIGGGSQIFTLSSGPADIWSGNSLSGDGFGGTPTPTYGSGDHSRSANTVGNDPSQPARNQLTVAQGVQWFLNLAVQHPDQYQRLLQMMHTAKYLSDAQYANAVGGYSSDAAGQFALAAVDLAAVNTTPGGQNLGLYDFLNAKADQAKTAAAPVAQPVTRAYQDPATLAYAARTAAQSVLGRNLTPAEEAAFQSSFRGKENAYYDNVDATNQAQVTAAAGNTRGPANTVPQPDTTGEAAQYVQGDQFSTQRAGYSMLEYLKAFQDLLGSGKL